MRPDAIVIIVGPQGCGKSTHAVGIAQRFGCVRIVDPWDGRSELLPGTVAVTNVPMADIATSAPAVNPRPRARKTKRAA